MERENRQRGKRGKRDWIFYGLVVVVLIAAIVYLYDIRDSITGFFGTVITFIWDNFGLGIILLAWALITAIFLLWRKRMMRLFKHWHRWLGIIAATLGVWGIMAFYGDGGLVGDVIIGEKDEWGGFRITGLFIVGFALFVWPVIVTRLKNLDRRTKKVVSAYRARKQQWAATRAIVGKNTISQKEIPQQPATQVQLEVEQTLIPPKRLPPEVVSDRKENMQTNAQPQSRSRMYCRHCGKELVGAPAFCAYCGTKAPVGNGFCPTCGAATYQSAAFCTKCRTRLLEE